METGVVVGGEGDGEWLEDMGRDEWLGLEPIRIRIVRVGIIIK